jgi:hypothetical protein
MENDLTGVLERFDRKSADALVRSLAEEFARLHRAYALLDARLTAVEALGKIASQVIVTDADALIRYPRSVEIDAISSFVDQTGFHELEHDGEGQPYRWTGPDRHFSFQILIDRSAPAAFTLCFGSFFADVSPDQLQAFVDGSEVALSVQSTSNGYEASSALPPRSEPGETTLTFVVPKVGSPQSNNSPDKRVLGVMFRWLKVQSDRHEGASEDAVGNNDANNLDEYSES